MPERPGPSQDEIDAHHASRTLSDAELLHGGAAFENNVLVPTAEQIIEISKQDPSPTAPERSPQPDFRARTFAEAKEIEHEFTDEQIIDLLTRPGAFIYNYTNFAPPAEPEERIFAETKNLVAENRKMRQLIKDHLKIQARDDVTQAARTFLASAQQTYLAQLDAAGATWERELLDYTTTGRPSRLLMQAGNLCGFEVPSTAGTNVDIVDFNSPQFADFRPNVRVQDTFVHWETSARSKQELNGSAPPFSSRIYLNPIPEMAIDTFETLMKEFEAAGFSALGKCTDISRDLMEGAAGKLKKVRTDNLVIYATPEEADQILDIVLSHVATEADRFANRPVPLIPVKLADGVAVGVDPQPEGSNLQAMAGESRPSLTGHREKILDEVVKSTLRDIGISSHPMELPDELKEPAIAAFRTHFKQLATASGVNPKNMAFNLE